MPLQTLLELLKLALIAVIPILTLLPPLIPATTPPPTLDTLGQLRIPRLKISTPIKQFVLGEKTWEIDPWETQIGHFEGTAWRPQTGNIVLGGHVEYPDGRPAIFNALHTLKTGDRLHLMTADETLLYAVTETYFVDFDDLTPLYPTTFNQITLITCDESSYNPETKSYHQRLVVVARQLDTPN